MPTPEGKPTIVIGAQLRKARELLGLTKEETAKEINVNPKDVDDWETDTSEPNLQQIESLANLYGREIDYFLKVTANPPAKIKFRGKPGQSLRNLPKDTKVTLAKFDESCRAAVEFEGLLSKKREVKLPIFSATVDPVTSARRIRDGFGLNDNPITDLRALLEDSGVRVLVMLIPDEGLSGFSFWHEDYGPCILVHAKDTPGRRNFTLAHELAHLVYRHGSCACYIPKEIGPHQERIEHKANEFAVELLLPRNGVTLDFQRRNLPKEPSEKQLGQMANKWGISIQALGYRLESLNLIKQGLTKRIVEARPAFLRRPKIPTWERRLGKSFVTTSIEAYQKNLISVSRLAHALQIPIRKAIEIVESGGR